MPPPSGGDPKLPLELYLPLIAPPETGSCCRMSPTEVSPVRSRSSRDIISTGACLPSGSPMREPVTTMTSPSVGGTASGTGASLVGGAAGAAASAGGAGGAGGASGDGGASGEGAAGGGGGDGAGCAACATRCDGGRMCSVG